MFAFTKATLFYKSPRGGWNMVSGDAPVLLKCLEKIYAPAFVRLENGKIVGYTDECEDGKMCSYTRKHTWHHWTEHGPPYDGLDGCPWADED